MILYNMVKAILKHVSIVTAWLFGIWCLANYTSTAEVISPEDIQEYMDTTDFYLAGKVTLIEDDAGSRGLYKMEYDTISIRNQYNGRCYWGVCDTATKNAYFHSYTLKTDYVYIDSKKRLITANPTDTVSMVNFRIFLIIHDQLRKYKSKGTICF